MPLSHHKQSNTEFRLWFAGVKGFCGNISCYTYYDSVRQNVNYISFTVNVNNYELTLGWYNADVDYSVSKCKFAYFKRSLFFQGKGYSVVLILVCCFYS